MTTSTKAGSIVRAEIARIANRLEEADRRKKAARSITDREALQAEADDIAGEFWLLESELADLLCLFFRVGRKHQADALRQYLLDLLQPSIEQLVEEAFAALRQRGNRA